ncbi:MAG: hypothetical protein V4649_01880 [Bacteroidota bacterium]
MRTQHRYVVHGKNNKLLKTLERLSVKCKILDKYIGDTTHIYALEFSLYEDNPQFSMQKEEIDKFGLDAQIGSIFDVDDYTRANWFWVSAGEYQYPQPEDDFGYQKRSFNLDNYCEVCGIGKNQNAPIRLRTLPKQEKNDFWGIHWEHEIIFVRQRAKRILEDAGVRGISFSHPVLHRNDNHIGDLFQLNIHTVLKRGFNDYNTRVLTCDRINFENSYRVLSEDTIYCGREKFHFPRIGGLTFDETIFNESSDIVKTNEYFGSGASAFQLPIFSKKLKTILDKEKIRGIYFEPIFHQKQST